MAVGKIAITLVSIFLVVGVVIGVMVVIKHDSKVHNSNTSTKAVASICELTDYKEACASSLESAAQNKTATPSDYILAAVEATLKEVNKSLEATGKIVVDKDKDKYNDQQGVENCKFLLEYAIDMLQDSISVVGESDLKTLEERGHELLSWMTAIYALQTTCTGEIENPEYKSAVENGMINATQLTHNAVNIVAELSQVLKLFGVQQLATPQRRLMSVNDGYPTWFGAADRKLLAQHSAGKVEPNVVVAKDGSGKFKTIREAVAAYPPKFKGRFVIYVKAGVYDEQVIIDKKKLNILMYGDGIGKTIVTGKKNFGTMNIKTMQTATFASEAPGFIARGMTFRNDAGPEGHQAVAFRSMGEGTALFECSFEANQDTLYYHINKQFYRNCLIYGTIDFIFGKGEAVIQDSEIVVRRPMANQINTVTADGHEIKKGSNGLIIQNCKIIPDNFLNPIRFEIKTYLGRPWTPLSRTVIMQSELGDLIQPEGWKVWDGANNHKTCEVFEHANRGLGAQTDRRSKDFANFKVISPEEAAKYTAGPFLEGDKWLPQTGVPFRLGL